MTVVALDGMGGDFAPGAAVGGAVRSAARGIEVVLVGDAALLDAELERLGGAPPGLRVVHAPDAIGMQEHVGRETLRRRESSIHVALELVKRGDAEAFVSLGNTGAVLALALAVLGRLPGVQRPALGALIPRSSGPKLLLDAGANAEAKVSHLVQWAQLGAAYMRAVVGVADPAVALLSIGEEPTKGSPLTIETHRVLSESSLRFLGNVEGRDVALGDADVIVTDGFTGNVVLKVMEGTVTLMLDELRTAARHSLPSRLGGQLMRPALGEVGRRLDYRQYGGAPLLGMNGVVIVGHGRSDEQAAESAIGAAAAATRQRLLEALSAACAGTAAGESGSADSGQ